MKVGGYLAVILNLLLGQCDGESLSENEESRNLLVKLSASMAGIYLVCVVVLFFYLCIREVSQPGTWSEYSPPHPGIHTISTYKFPEKTNTEEKGFTAGEQTEASKAAISDDEDDGYNVDDDGDYDNESNTPSRESKC